MPHWSSRVASAATNRVGGSIQPEQPLWAGGVHEIVAHVLAD